jgi:hypothetical protein
LLEKYSIQGRMWTNLETQEKEAHIPFISRNTELVDDGHTNGG